jgi:SAM-dependent methyltransferase
MVKKLTFIRDKVKSYYSEKVLQFGATPAGVDWNSPESQQLRFEQLVKVCDGSSKFSINDLGCGYGAMYDYLTRQGFQFLYSGYDLSDSMINEARRLTVEKSNCEFAVGDSLREADYTVASGVFNVKMDVDSREWERYVLEVLEKIDQASRRGFAFNILTRYSDPEHMKDHLYYPDPCFYFDYCKKKFSKHVALLHDYPLYEFSILVRKDI